MLNLNLNENDAGDSFETLDVFMGKSKENRSHVIEQASGTLSIIQDDWKYIEPSNRQAYNKKTRIELGNNPQPQLYNLANDIGERNNLANENPEKLKELQELLQKLKDEGRTRN